MSDISSKLEEILGKMNDLDKAFQVYAKGNDEVVKQHGKDIQEVRSDLWGKDGLKGKVETHEHSISILKWISCLIGTGAILALTNSILRLIVK